MKNGFSNIRHFTDDGIRGTTFKRPGLDAMLDEIRAGNVATVIIKDQSRIGRDVVEVGLLKRTFDEYHEAQDESPLQKLIDQSRYDDIRDAAIAYIQEDHSGDTKRLSVIDMEIENVIHIEQLEDGVIAFDVIASCDVEMPSASRKGFFNERWLKIHCQVTLGIDMSGFRIISVGNCEPQEESDNDRLSGELVPIISREQFEDEAEKFLTRYCPEALDKPMRVPIETIASDMKLHVIEEGAHDEDRKK